ncbi:hypothetical protein CAEBREN_14856 [Caenorhabditis brenneri]|uniref:Sdz-33 F-box domain-containing protein n=1 Tax=Caenorhabditis brenneri TaxID=135651 RepID=G0MQH1_CAEBE|nr:hypothetical protein CAEBREN_14856 [Caenorhabditis brenneri]
MKTHDIINLTLFSPLFKDQVNIHPKLTKEVKIHLSGRLEVSIEEDRLNFYSGNVLQLTPLRTWTPEQQVEFLKDLFNLEVALECDDFTASLNNCERMFVFFSELNVVQISFIEFGGHLRFFEQLRPSTTRLRLCYNPGLPNFQAVLARPFNYLAFVYPMSLKDILSINCKDTEIWSTRFLEDGMTELLNRWINGWNPLLEKFVVQFTKRRLQEDYIDRIMANVRNFPASISEGHPEVNSDCLLWRISTSTDRTFTLRGMLMDGRERTAKVVFDTFRGAMRLKIIALN